MPTVFRGVFSAGQVVQADYLARRDLLLAKLALQHRRIGVHLCPHRLAVADGAHDGVLGSFAANTVVCEGDDYVVVGDEAAGREVAPFSANRAKNWPNSPLP